MSYVVVVCCGASVIADVSDSPICERHTVSNMNLQLHVDHATKEWDDVFEFSEHGNVAVVTGKRSAVLQRVMKY
jgi:hypothetical protein